MTSGEGGEAPEKPRKKAHKGQIESPPIDLRAAPPLPSATARLDEMTRARITSLELDKRGLIKKVDTLQTSVDSLSPENARLREALGNAQTNGAISTVLTTIGGGIVSYATFTGKTSMYVATGGVVALLIGACLMITSSVRVGRASRRRTES
jgi:hypothetical protein